MISWYETCNCRKQYLSPMEKTETMEIVVVACIRNNNVIAVQLEISYTLFFFFLEYLTDR